MSSQDAQFQRVLENGIRKFSINIKFKISDATLPISKTFDLCTDRGARGFIVIAGPYFNNSLVLRAPLLAVEYLRNKDD